MIIIPSKSITMALFPEKLFNTRTALACGFVAVVVMISDVVVKSGATVVSVHEYLSQGHPPIQFS